MIDWGENIRTGERAAAFCFLYEGTYYHIGRNYAVVVLGCGMSCDPWWLAKRVRVLSLLKVDHGQG